MILIINILCLILVVNGTLKLSGGLKIISPLQYSVLITIILQMVGTVIMTFSGLVSVATNILVIGSMVLLLFGALIGNILHNFHPKIEMSKHYKQLHEKKNDPNFL